MYFEEAHVWLSEQEVITVYNYYLKWRRDTGQTCKPIPIIHMNWATERNYILMRAISAGYGSAPEPKTWEPWIGKFLVWLGLAEWATSPTTQTK